MRRGSPIWELEGNASDFHSFTNFFTNVFSFGNRVSLLFVTIVFIIQKMHCAYYSKNASFDYLLCVKCNLRNVDLNLLHALYALLEERHVSHAAKRSFLSQPAMSRALDRLRETFGDPLLVRTGRVYERTPRGDPIFSSRRRPNFGPDEL